MTGRPLLITDCDEVLLHMVSHFDAWLDEAHQIERQAGAGRRLQGLGQDDAGCRQPLRHARCLVRHPLSRRGVAPILSRRQSTPCP